MNKKCRTLSDAITRSARAKTVTEIPIAGPLTRIINGFSCVINALTYRSKTFSALSNKTFKSSVEPTLKLLKSFPLQ